MIIRNNLASAPIKNYSLFLFGCILIAVMVVLFTLWNLAGLTTSYSESSDLRKTIASQQKQIQDLETKAKDLQSKIDRIKTPGFVAEAEFMNNAIKRRTFSWTALFDHFEEVLPPTVKMTSITPTVSGDKIAINLEMAARSLADMLDLVRVMERDPAFSQVVLKGERIGEEEDQMYFSLSLDYTPVEGHPPRTQIGASTTAVAAVPEKRNNPGSNGGMQ